VRTIGKTLLIQFCALELFSLWLFLRGGFGVVAGLVGPLWGIAQPFVALAQWSDIHSSAEELMAGLIGVTLFAFGFVAWFYFRSRIASHAAFALFGLFSILLLAAALT
jgi:hypothetical protein